MYYCTSSGVKMPAIEVEGLKNDLLGCLHKDLHKVGRILAHMILVTTIFSDLQLGRLALLQLLELQG